ncbi:NlpC/P60 family protein [Rudaeicoccus suwonensis]|uniref:Transglycosylase-like protein with SLT domain n=1 Tax=Rudaeicoccus suwonensis TaxID=657409 RepID=A0A561DVH9_9MICO|nr:NlpC/P60 family protein [Rudaeicoccus suwonensis]TWE07366.1 transglycosylase-like protein with SLT domain [Rudaeicoccus suwonensis]
MSGGSSKVMASGVGALLALPILVVAATSGKPPVVSPISGGLRNVPAQYVALVEKAGSMCSQISPPVIAAQIDVESGWNPDARSAAGAEGIAQFMPGTWATWGKDYDGNGTPSPFDPGDAIPAQGAFMCSLAKQAQAAMNDHRIVNGSVLDNALASYNAGFGAVLSSQGVPTGIAQTDAYYKKIESLIASYTTIGGTVSGPYGQAAVEAAQQWLGLPYVFGGGTVGPPPGPTMGGFDCSGLAAAVVAKATGGRLLLEHYSTAQYETSQMTTVASYSGFGLRPLSSMAPGDVIIFNIPLSLGYDSHPWNHAGIYIGNGQMIDAPKPGAVVRVDNIASSWPYQWVARRPLAQYTATSSSSAAAAAVMPGTPAAKPAATQPVPAVEDRTTTRHGKASR